MKRVLLLFIFCISIAGFSQKKKPITKAPIPLNISNIKLGLTDRYIIEKYGPAPLDSIHNSTRILAYTKVVLDNKFELNNVFFHFFKDNLFLIMFDADDSVHRALTAKYGYKEIDETVG